MSSEKLSYKDVGVNYDVIDPFKVFAQQASALTASSLAHHGFSEISASRGESAYLVDLGPLIIASITECLGTKILIADSYYQQTQHSYYAAIAQDTLAMAINDLITVGALPFSCHAYWAAGHESWFKDKRRTEDLIAGWRDVCKKYNLAWGGGETPCLNNVVHAETIDLAASALGYIHDRRQLSVGGNLQSGTQIVLLSSSGIHSNGVSLARSVAERLPDGYLTPLADGTPLGEALLQPTHIYSGFIAKLFAAGIFPQYMANITGHGWQKVMRSPNALTYVIDHLPPVPQEMTLICDKAKLSAEEAYKTFNMGAGFAIFVAAEDVETVLALANDEEFTALHAGYVEGGDKKVVISPLNITYHGDDFKLRN